MTDKQTPSDWVLIEAAKRCGFLLNAEHRRDTFKSMACFRALCDMIQKYEQPPLDLKTQCAITTFGEHDIPGQMKCIKAIELYLEKANA